MRRLLLALAATLALAMQPTEAPTASADCTGFDCPLLFTTLRNDILNPGLVREPLQRSLLVKADLAERSAPVDPCQSLRHLGTLTNEVNALQRAEQITPNAANILAGDVSAIVTAIAPVDPC